MLGSGAGPVGRNYETMAQINPDCTQAGILNDDSTDFLLFKVF